MLIPTHYEITSFTVSSREHRQIGSGRVFDFDVGLLIKNTQVLRACVKPSVKIFTVALKITDSTDGGLKEAFVSQYHSKTLPLH